MEVPVLIVGAGPSGLTLAMQLHRYGVPFRIIDKQRKPVATSNALAVQMSTLDTWDDMGLLDTAKSLGTHLQGIRLYTDKKPLGQVDFSDSDKGPGFILGLSQSTTEKMMIDYLENQGITVEMDVELVDFIDDNSNYLVTLKNKAGKVEQLKTNWLLACDGIHSPIREKAQVEFVGKKLTQHFVLADVVVESELAKNRVNAFLSKKGGFFLIDFDKQYTRLIAEIEPDSPLFEAKSLTDEEVTELAQKRCAFELDMSKPFWTSGFWIQERIVTNYRHKNIFFVGDAAHVHSPAGGQGMNTGIQDAYNLAWKLALVILQYAQPSILDTYNSERHPVGVGVLKITDGLTRAVSLHNPFLIAIRNCFLYLVLQSKTFKQKLINRIGQYTIKYSESALVRSELESDPKVGMRMLNATFEVNGRPLSVFDMIRGREFVVLVFSDVIDASLQSLKQKYTGIVKFILIPTNKIKDWNGEMITDERLAIRQFFKVTKECAYIIRPDKYLGFKGEIMDIKTYFDGFLH